MTNKDEKNYCVHFEGIVQHATKNTKICFPLIIQVNVINQLVNKMETEPKKFQNLVNDERPQVWNR